MKIPNRTIMSIAILMILARVFAGMLTPSKSQNSIHGDFDLATSVPSSFKGWTLDPAIITIQPNEEGNLKDKIYNQTISRGYRDESGYLIMLVIAYGQNQSDTLQLHRPEVCYVANGFEILSNSRGDVAVVNSSGIAIPSRRVFTRNNNRVEPVTYWTRVGNALPTSTLSRQYEKLKFGLSGNIPDGVLVRVSSISDEPLEAYKIHDKFINDMLDSINPKGIGLFLGPLSDKINEQ